MRRDFKILDVDFSYPSYLCKTNLKFWYTSKFLHSGILSTYLRYRSQKLDHQNQYSVHNMDWGTCLYKVVWVWEFQGTRRMWIITFIDKESINTRRKIKLCLKEYIAICKRICQDTGMWWHLSSVSELIGILYSIELFRNWRGLLVSAQAIWLQ